MRSSSCWCSVILILFVVLLRISGYQAWSDEDAGVGHVVKRDDRQEIVSTEYGTISSVDVDGINRYELQLISLDPNSLFLPAILHAHMVFYVQTGSGRLSYSSQGKGKGQGGGGGEMKEIRVRRGDVLSLQSGTIFFMQSDLEPQAFRINAIFSNARGEEQAKLIEAGPYSFIHHLFQGFDKTLLQAAFQVSEEIIEEITNGSCRTPPIVHASTASKEDKRGLNIVDGITTSFGMDLLLNKKKKPRKEAKLTFNLFNQDPDVKNCNGWSTAITSQQLPALKASNIGVFMVNLTTNAMMGPHWNPIATEIGVVLEGRGILRVVCSSNLTRPECNNTRFLVEEGDIFVVPRFHPMAHMSFNNQTLVFMGFTTSHSNNHPQFLAGEASVLRALNHRILQLALNVNTTTISKLLGARKGSTILDCVSCAEEELQIEQREEKFRKQQEEEQRRRVKEEEERKRQEKEEHRRREKKEEERRHHEKEEQRKQEKEREEQRRKEEEEEKRWKEDERRRREEDEKRREEEKRRRQEEEGRKHQEEKEKRRRQEEEEEGRKRQEEKEKRRRREEEETRQKEEERRQKQEEKREQEEEHREEEEQRQQEEKERKEEEERRQREEEERRQQGEQEERKRQREQMEEATTRREEEERERSRQRHHKAGEESEEEAATREEEEREAQWEEHPHPHPSYMPIS